jgi:putative PIN family toxin of toxin-antitoxin system
VSAFFIIDTHVVVAGLLAAHVDSPVARILDGMLSAIFACVVSEALLAEYRAVLLRPKLCKLHGLSEPEVDIILTDIARHSIVLTPSNDAKVTSSAPDPGDHFLWNLLHARADLVLVTDDKLLLADVAMQQRIISPQAFIAQLTH